MLLFLKNNRRSSLSSLEKTNQTEIPVIRLVMDDIYDKELFSNGYFIRLK